MSEGEELGGNKSHRNHVYLGGRYLLPVRCLRPALLRRPTLKKVPLIRNSISSSCNEREMDCGINGTTLEELIIPWILNEY